MRLSQTILCFHNHLFYEYVIHSHAEQAIDHLLHVPTYAYNGLNHCGCRRVTRHPKT